MLFISSGLFAQVTQVCFNEVLVTNHTNYVDGYGERVPWIELFNGAYNTVNLGGCFLSNDINNPKKYRIPKGDVLTLIQKRQHVLFYADNNPSRGTFHLNFTLDSASANTLYLFNTDGTTLIDSVTVPVLSADVSWGRYIDGDSEWGMITRVTPSTNNLTLDSNEKVEKFAENDPNGVGMSISAMGVVFLVLVVCALVFGLIAYIIKRFAKRKLSKSVKAETLTASSTSTDEVPGDVMAAISMAIYQLTNDAHDVENTVLTISKTRRTYSPWSSKIYGLRQLPK